MIPPAAPRLGRWRLRRLNEKFIPDCAGFSFVRKASFCAHSGLCKQNGNAADERKDQQDGMKFSRNRLSFQAIDPVRLPNYPGSAWRGALGHALLRQTCLTGQHDCPACPVRRDCDYATLFEPILPPSADPDARRRYRDPPRPYVLHIPWSHAGDTPPGGGYSLEFTLFGEAVDRCPDFIQALAEAAAGGIGAGQGRLSLKRVQPLPIPNCPAPPKTDRILTLLTPPAAETPGPPRPPPRLQPRPHRPSPAAPRPLAHAYPDLRSRSHPRRSRTMSHIAPRPVLERLATLLQPPKELPKTRRRPRTTAPPRPRRPHPPPLALLWWGQYTHAGKGAVMGLGAYRVRLDCGAEH